MRNREHDFPASFCDNSKMSVEKRFLEAIRSGDVDAVDQMLKSKEIDVNQKLDGITVLVHGINRGNPDIVACIIENGADVGTSDVLRGSSLRWAIVKYGGRRQQWDQEEEQWAFEVFYLIVEAYKKLGSQKLIEDAFIERDQRKDIAFLEAIRDGLSNVVLILIDLITEETVQFLNVGDFQCRNGRNPFHYVYRLNGQATNATFGRLPFKEQMINEMDRDGYTPLNFVVAKIGRSLDIHRQHRAAVVLLLNNGANPNLPGKFGQTPLHRAICLGCSSICDLLLRAGCRTDIPDVAGSSALKTAVLSCRAGLFATETTIKLIKLLLVYGVDLDKEPYLYADDELPLEYRRPEYGDQINETRLNPVLLEKLRELRKSGRLNSLKHRCRVAVLCSLKISIDEVDTQLRGGKDSAIDSLPLSENLTSYLRGDGDKVLALFD